MTREQYKKLQDIRRNLCDLVDELCEDEEISMTEFGLANDASISLYKLAKRCREEHKVLSELWKEA